MQDALASENFTPFEVFDAYESVAGTVLRAYEIEETKLALVNVVMDIYGFASGVNPTTEVRRVSFRVWLEFEWRSDNLVSVDLEGVSIGQASS
ncbi:hypothetical protein CF166_20945 [Amycolatopsis sp. KNN50.9b]|nr:hypothetical protein CF166_20945 [Amycolatopsis sp. KNN50.9b]